MTPIEKLREALPFDIDAALITGGFNRRYLTGFASSAGTLVLTRKQAVFIIDSRYYEGACKTIRNCDVVLQDKLFQQIGALLKDAKAERVAVESEICTVKELNLYRKELPNITFLEDNRLSDQLSLLRRIKTPQELARMRRAQEYTDQTFTHILEKIKPGVTEKEIALELDMAGRRMGADRLAFVIVASGENSSQPHCTPSDRVLREGDFITLDFGFFVDGYCSDMTRTVALGPVSDKQQQVYETVRQAQEAAFAQIKPGAICREVDTAARRLIDSSPFAGTFGHGLGHSLGLEVHEAPAFNQTCEVALEPGMVLSVEPGIYLPGEFGVRIEDVVVCTSDGFENLTKSPKDLIIL
jgi:Xaa-Pro aminopeptidase